jgi:hypothetical protein
MVARSKPAGRPEVADREDEETKVTILNLELKEVSHERL